jgi:uncharacterized damage-inducible protein DinB
MPRGRPLEVEHELVEAFRRSGLASEYLVSLIPDAIWQAPPPTGRGRTIAAIVAHMQSVRRTFARMGGAPPVPPLDRKSVTRAQARRALRQSTDDLASLFESGIAAGRARVKGQPRRLVDMLTYLMMHDAHHRGQITTLAKDFGHEFRGQDITRMWGWAKLPGTNAQLPNMPTPKNQRPTSNKR